MKGRILLLMFVLSSNVFTFGQEEGSRLEDPLGLRIERNGQDYLIYADSNLNPNFNDYRKINYQVYFRKVNIPKKKMGTEEYQLITIPGSSSNQNQNENKNKSIRLADGSINYPRSGKIISEKDYDCNFWIAADVIENSINVSVEYYKYSNDVFSGLLTAPFKYRLKLGDAPESLFDGDFNIAPFVGWKWRVSSVRPFYVAPFTFAGLTTLEYNSANNAKIIDPDKTENGVGLTYGFGLSFKFGDISPGFIVGWDKGFGNTGSGFLYNDIAWISFSVNYDFFKPKKTATDQ